MSLVLGRNRRNRETRKLLVPLSLHLVIVKAKKQRSSILYLPRFHCMKYLSPTAKKGHFQAQITIALIKPRLLNALRTTSVSSSPGLTQPPPHCALAVSAAVRSCGHACETEPAPSQEAACTPASLRLFCSRLTNCFSVFVFMGISKKAENILFHG